MAAPKHTQFAIGKGMTSSLMQKLIPKPIEKKEDLLLPEDFDLSKVPRHIAIIMDGNRRWAKQNGQRPDRGHMKGADTVIEIVKVAARLGVKTVTVYTFSTENWNRTKKEIDVLMQIFHLYLNKMRQKMVQEGVRLDTIGDLSPFPNKIKNDLTATKEATKHCKRIDLVLALNYGGRDDIRRAAIRVAEDYKQGIISPKDLNEAAFASYLDTAKWPDPDLLIRTSGESRISNFLLWQISYSEVYITDVLWPDFTDQDLIKAIQDFQLRKRRYGG